MQYWLPSQWRTTTRHLKWLNHDKKHRERGRKEVIIVPPVVQNKKEEVEEGKNQRVALEQNRSYNNKSLEEEEDRGGRKGAQRRYSGEWGGELSETTYGTVLWLHLFPPRSSWPHTDRSRNPASRHFLLWASSPPDSRSRSSWARIGRLQQPHRKGTTQTGC